MLPEREHLASDAPLTERFTSGTLHQIVYVTVRPTRTALAAELAARPRCKHARARETPGSEIAAAVIDAILLGEYAPARSGRS